MERYQNEFLRLHGMKFDEISDKKILKFVKLLLQINRNYKEHQKYVKNNNFQNSVQGNCVPQNDFSDFRHGSFIISRVSSLKSTRTFSLFSKKKICNIHSDKEEEIEMIKFAFGKLVQIFPSEGNKKIFFPCFIQFLLDSYIITQHFMSLFLLPLNKEKWVELDKFMLALESIQQMSFERASFFYQEKDSVFKKNMTIQKMLCKGYSVFFKLVEFCCGCELNESDLACVISMALKNSKKSTDCKVLAKNTFEKIERISKVKKETISFKDFFRILINNN